MDNEFENIVPWNGANDTGRDVRLKWQRNFERIKANFEEVLKLLGEVDVEKLAKYFIRKDQDDQTDHLVKFLAGLEVGEFIDSLSAGKGTKLFSDGRGQMNILELRKQIQIGEAILFWDDTNKGIGVKRASSPASEDGTGEVKENEIGIYSLGWMSAKGIDKGEEEGSGAGSTTIGGLTNVGSWADQTADYDRIMVQLSGSNTWTEKRLDEIGGGLDEEQLAAYLTENNYAKTGDIPSLDGYATETWVTGRGYITSAALNGYATQSWVVGKGYATTSDLDARIDALVNGAPAAFDTLKEIADVLQGNVDSIDDILTTIGTKADKSISISAGTGLTGGGTLSANRTLSLKPATTSALGGIIVGDRLSIDSSGRLTATYTYTHPSATATTITAATGKVLSAITVNSLGHVTSVAAKTLAAADIPSLAISKITGLQAELDKKLDKSVLDDLFEKVEIREGVYAIRAKYGLFTNEFLSAKGMDEGSESPGGGATKLSELTDVSLTNLKNNDLLRWNGTRWVNVPQSSISPSLAWENITGKPSTFPPSAHTHTKSQITDFPATWAWGAISGKPTTVKGYGITDAVTINDDQTINSSKKWAAATSDLFIGYNESGTASVKHIIHTTAGWARGYSFVNEENGTYCSFGAYGQGTTLVYQYVGNNYLSPWQKWNGTRSDLSVPLYVNNYKVWHEGNVGSGSGLNADLLDGVHREGLFTNLGSSTVTKLSLTIGNTTKSLTSLYASHADTVRATACNSTTNSKLWNEFRVTTKNGTLNVYDVYNDGGPTTYGNIIEVVSNVSNHWQPQLWFEGSANGSLYHRNKNYNGTVWSEWAILLDSRNYSAYVEKIGTETVGSNVNPIYLNAGVPTKSSYSFGNASGNIPVSNGTLNSNLNADLLDGVHLTGLFTSATSNSTTNLSLTVGGTTKSIVDLFANTASKLETARTIWGQSFDGTKNILGAISGATTINASGAVTFGSTLAVTGAVTLKSTLSVSGIITATAGLTTPQYLQVGDGRIYWDSTNKALYVKHKDGTTAIGFYSLGWMSAKGVDSGTDGSTGGGNFFGVIVNGSTYRVDDEGYVTIPDYPTSLNWANISGKPSTFPPLAHTHTKSQITDFPTTWAWGAISGKPSWIGSTKPSYAWSEITGKPTTLSGYGITDGVNAVTVSGSGNAVTSASISGHKLTLTKGSTFLLSSQYTANDILTKLKTVDGEDSGLDADLLDGYHGSESATANTYVLRTSTGSIGTKAVEYKSNYYATPKAKGWYRIFKFSTSNANGASAIIHIDRLYYTPSNESYTFAVNISFGTGISITQLSGYANGRLITKVRVDYTNSGDAFIDFYYDTTSHFNNIVYCYGSGRGNFQTPTLVSEATGSVYEFKTVNGFGCSEGIGGVDTSLLYKAKILSAQSLNANNLTENYTQYEPIGNMNTWASSFTFTNFPTAKPGAGFSLLNIKEGNYRRQIYGCYNDNHLYVRSSYYSGSGTAWKSWNKVAFVTDNVTSATKLQNPRTIWGKAFDGTANVSGDLSNVGKIIFSDTDSLLQTTSQSFNFMTSSGAAKGIKVKSLLVGEGYGSSVNSGCITASGDVTANRIIITDTDPVSHIEFKRDSYNYLTAPAGTNSSINFIVNGHDLLIANADLSVRNGLVCAGTNNATSLGNSTYRWSALYSVLGNFSGAVTMASTLAVTGALTAKGGVNFNGSQLTNVSRIEFQPGDAGRKTVITNSGSFLLYGATGGWSAGLGYYGSDGTTSLGNAAGAYGIGNTLNYYYYGGTYSSPKMVLLPGGNFGIGTTAPSQKLHVAGNILATGSITAKSVSDLRLKTILTTTADYRHKLLSLGRVVDFYYNDKAIQRNTGAVDRERHTGLVYQSAKEIGLPNFCHTDDDGYGAINYLCTDYINLIAGALQQTIVAQETIEQRVDRLERENEELKRQLNNLTAA